MTWLPLQSCGREAGGAWGQCPSQGHQGLPHPILSLPGGGQGSVSQEASGGRVVQTPTNCPIQQALPLPFLIIPQLQLQLLPATTGGSQVPAQLVGLAVLGEGREGHT